MKLDHWLRCPACGFAGRRARRRNARAADAALIRFHAHLADQSRRRRAGAGGLLSTMDCRALGVGPAERIPREEPMNRLLAGLNRDLSWYLDGEQGEGGW